MTTTKTRLFPMQKPDGHQPVIQRYSSRVDADVERIWMLVLGQQTSPDCVLDQKAFLRLLAEVLGETGQPTHHDMAGFVDNQGYQNSFAVCYWHNEEDYAAWTAKFDQWWARQNAQTLAFGIWIETFSVPPAYRETNLFKEYIRGVSACPMSRIEPMDESGYWGAARDRFEASRYDKFVPEAVQELHYDGSRETLGKRIVVNNIPNNLCVIRSGVTWKYCGAEQFNSFERDLKPRLDAGMDYLRENPEDTGCCSLRQVICMDEQGQPQKEEYSLGLFLTYGHLEKWAHNHPTHLAIYAQAIAGRKKYQENLELLTYHEIYVLNEDVRCEYLNCQPNTGLLPYFTNEMNK